MDETGEVKLDKLASLLEELAPQSTEVVLEPKEFYDFNVKDRVILVEEGEVLVMSQPDPQTGRSRRHVLRRREPYGAAEAITSRVPNYECTVQAKTKLRVFDGAAIRDNTNKAGVFTRTVVRIFLKRVFEAAESDKDRKASIVFEDDFIYANRDDLRNMEVPAETLIFKAKAPADKMYFIEKGAVSIVTETNKVIATLGVGEIFGEAVLLGDDLRTGTALVERDADLWSIEAAFARRELSQENAMTQLATILCLLQVRVVNQLKGLR